MNFSSVSLPRKFDQYSLNKQPELNPALKNSLDNLSTGRYILGPFATPNGWRPIGGKGHIVEHASLPGYIIKGHKPVTEAGAYRDSNFYRLRKADRIRRSVAKHNLGDKVVVPQKYLYESRHGEKIIVVQKLALTPITGLFTLEEAKTLSHIAADAGLSDAFKGNIMRNSDGKLAIIDTEPVYRVLKKTTYNPFDLHFLEKVSGLCLIKEQSVPEAAAHIDSLITKEHLKIVAVKVMKCAAIIFALTAVVGACVYFAMPVALIAVASAVALLVSSFCLLSIIGTVVMKGLALQGIEISINDLKTKHLL